ncbi:MAG: NifU family protein [Holosporales bacterium]
MFIQTEETPNPATLKFIPGRTVLAGATATYPSREAAANNPLAHRLFEVSGVEGVFFGEDFISITKNDAVDWLVIKPALLGAIMDYFLRHDQVTLSEDAQTSTPTYDTSDPVIAEICELLETRIRPAVAQDGGDIQFVKFENGIVYVSMHGACSGCPSSTATLKSGIENMLRHYVPEVQEVCAI